MFKIKVKKGLISGLYFQSAVWEFFSDSSELGSTVRWACGLLRSVFYCMNIGFLKVLNANHHHISFEIHEERRKERSKKKKKKDCNN